GKICEETYPLLAFEQDELCWVLPLLHLLIHPELPAAMHQAHEVQQSVIVACAEGVGYGWIPERFHEIFRDVVCGREAGNGVGSNQTLAMRCIHDFTIKGVNAAVGVHAL